MSEHDEIAFQQGMNEALRRYDPNNALVRYVRMDKGSDVSDLTLNADVLVGHAGLGKEQCIAVVSYSCIKHFFEEGTDLRDFDPLAEGSYSVGHPMVIVDTLNPDSAVRAILRYIRIERPAREP